MMRLVGKKWEAASPPIRAREHHHGDYLPSRSPIEKITLVTLLDLSDTHYFSLENSGTTNIYKNAQEQNGINGKVN
jgi:hypothetical protein